MASAALRKVVAVSISRVVTLVERWVDASLCALRLFDLKSHLGLLRMRNSGQIIFEDLLKKVFLALYFHIGLLGLLQITLLLDHIVDEATLVDLTAIHIHIVCVDLSFGPYCGGFLLQLQIGRLVFEPLLLLHFVAGAERVGPHVLQRFLPLQLLIGLDRRELLLISFEARLLPFIADEFGLVSVESIFDQKLMLMILVFVALLSSFLFHLFHSPVHLFLFFLLLFLEIYFKFLILFLLQIVFLLLQALLPLLDSLLALSLLPSEPGDNFD